MAKKSQTELLEGILLLLDQTLGETKKKNKAVGESNAPKSAGIVNAKDVSAKTLGDALSVISSAVPKLAKISEKQYDTVAKGIEKLATAINSFKMDKDTLASVSNMVSAFVQIHNVISGMSENFIKSILSLNPIKAWILGRRLGKFYGILAKGMVETFVKQLVNIINQIPPNKNVHSKTFKERLVNFGLMMAALLQIKEKQIMQLWMMGVFLGPKIGKAIGGFFKELIDKLAGGRNGVEKAKAAAKAALSVAALVGTLSLCLIALVILWKTNDIKDLLGGFGLLTLVVAFTLGIIWILGSDKFKKSALDGLDGVKMVLLLIGGLTLTLVILVDVGKKDMAIIAKGLLLFAVVVGTAIGLMAILSSKKFKQQKNESLMGVTAILLLIFGLTIAANMTTKFADTWKETLTGLGIMVAFTLASIGLLFLLSLVAKSKARMLNALIGVGAIIALTTGMSLAMSVFIKYVNKLDKAGLMGADGWKKVGRAAGIMGAVIAGVVGIVAVLAAISLIPGAKIFLATGAIILGAISGIIFVITEVTNNFVDLIERIHDLTQDKINDAVNKILGTSFGKSLNDNELPEDNISLIGALGAIIKGMACFGVKAALKAGIIGKTIKPVIEAISDFVDVVQKMASLQVADQWDPKTGKPTHYLKLSPVKFKEAAKNLTGAFSTFLTDLSNGLKGFDIASLAIIQLLFPRQSRLSKLLTGEKPSIGMVIKVLSDFVDVIHKMASLNVPDKWDKNGNPISYRKLDPEKDFKTAAVNLSGAFSTFLTELGNGLKGLGVISAGILAIVGDELGSVLQGIGAAFSPIIQIAAGKIQIGDKVVDINETKLKSAASTVVSILTDIINFLGHSKAIAEADWNADKFKDTLEDFCDGVKYLNNIKKEMFLPEFTGNISNLTNGLNGIVQYLNTNFKTAKSNSAIFNETMKNTASGINRIKPFLSATPKQIVDLANAMKQLDAELITKEEQRTKAIQSVASNFKDMASSINQLNESLSESMRISRLYDQMKSVTSGNIIAKGVSAAVEGAGVVANKVKEALSDNKTEEQQKTKEEAIQKDREEFANVIASAVSAALTAWSESHKDLTVQFSDSPEKIFGEVYNI